MIKKLAALWLLSFCAGSALRAQPLIDFPTQNHALAEGRPQDFFMYVDRDFEGEKSKPWQGGQFGYVRGPVRSNGTINYIQLHEGVDIRPLHRDSQGIPLDIVKAAAAGQVVHVSRQANGSNYGRYVVIEHRWDGSLYYTLYAHLASISVEPGQIVAQGAPLGMLGFTGAGINKERAHLHFEICLLLSDNFEGWHATHFPGTPNLHAIYNGLNLVGLDPSRVLLEARSNPGLKITDIIQATEPTFKITVRNSPNFSLLKRYPWLLAPGQLSTPPAWTISFSRHGVPLKIEAASTPVSEPVVAWVKEDRQPYTRITKGLVDGKPGAPKLTDTGKKFALLLTWPD